MELTKKHVWAPRVPLDTGRLRTIAYFDPLLSEAGETKGPMIRSSEQPA
jgi:hypothetical protein